MQQSMQGLFSTVTSSSTLLQKHNLSLLGTGSTWWMMLNKGSIVLTKPFSLFLLPTNT